MLIKNVLLIIFYFMSNFLNIQAKLKVLLSQRIENHVFFFYLLSGDSAN